MHKYSGILLFAFVLPLPIPLLFKTIALCIMLLNLLFEEKKRFSFKGVFGNTLIILSIFFFLIDTITGLINESVFVIREIKLSFLLIPAIFLWKKESLKKARNYVELSFVLGVVVYIVYAWGYAVYFYTIKHPHYEFSLLNDYVRYIFYHYLPGAIDHNYLGMYIFLAALISYKGIVGIKKKWSIVLAAILVINMPFLGGKTLIVITLLFAMCVVFIELRKRVHFSLFRKLAIILAALTLICTSLLVVTNWFPNSLRSSVEKREAIYTCAYQASKDFFWSGVGFRNIGDIAQHCDGYDRVFKPHSIFLDELLSNGIFGLLLLVTILVYLLKMAIESKDIVFISLVTLGVLVGLGESIFSRQWGVFFFVFFSAFYCAVYSSFDNLKKRAR